MNFRKWKKIASFLLIVIGAILLLIEIGTDTNNYYTQSVGVIFLMGGLFFVNSNVSSKFSNTEIEEDNNEEE